MNIDLRKIVLSREAYIFVLIVVVAALATAGIPMPIFLCLLSMIVVIGAITEATSQLLARKLSDLSLSSEREPTGGIDVAVLLSSAASFGLPSLATSGAPRLAFDDDEPEFAQTTTWFVSSQVGTFA